MIACIHRDEKKWMVVNIQCHEEFSSHMLNRDTWIDETVISLLGSSFVFWQRGHTSGDAQVNLPSDAIFYLYLNSLSSYLS